MKPVPRTKRELRALVDHTTGLWLARVTPEYSAHPKATRELKRRYRIRAKELVEHCLSEPVKA